jgi:hypothetical protein
VIERANRQSELVKKVLLTLMPSVENFINRKVIYVLGKKGLMENELKEDRTRE